MHAFDAHDSNTIIDQVSACTARSIMQRNRTRTHCTTKNRLANASRRMIQGKSFLVRWDAAMQTMRPHLRRRKAGSAKNNAQRTDNVMP